MTDFLSRLQFPKGKVEPLSLLFFACVVFYFSTLENVAVWQRVIFVALGTIATVLCLATFRGMPCKRRLETGSKCFDICLRDIGFTVGLVLGFLFVSIIKDCYLDAVAGWNINTWWKVSMVLVLSLPTVIHGAIRRLYKGIEPECTRTKVFLFVSGVLNGIVTPVVYIFWFRSDK